MIEEMPVRTELTVLAGDPGGKPLGWKVYERSAGVREPVNRMEGVGPENPFASGDISVERGLEKGQWVYVPGLAGGYHEMRVTGVGADSATAESEGWLAMLERDMEEAAPGLPLVWGCVGMINKRGILRLDR